MNLLILTSLFLAAFLLREHLMQVERRRWERERSGLLNRIKPETAQHVPLDEEPELFQPPRTEQEYWDQRERELA